LRQRLDYQHDGSCQDKLLDLNAKDLLRVVTALLDRPINQSLSSKVGDSNFTWIDLVKDGVTTLRQKHIDMPFVFIRIYCENIRYSSSPWLGSGVHESGWRQNEKCDIAVVTLHLLQWYCISTTPTVKRFSLKKCFRASTVLQRIPKCSCQL